MTPVACSCRRRAAGTFKRVIRRFVVSGVGRAAAVAERLRLLGVEEGAGEGGTGATAGISTEARGADGGITDADGRGAAPSEEAAVIEAEREPSLSFKILPFLASGGGAGVGTCCVTGAAAGTGFGSGAGGGAITGAAACGGC
jgi:hypothetical protein